MAKKKHIRRNRQPLDAADGAVPAPVAAPRSGDSRSQLAAEASSSMVVAILALMMCLAPALGVPHEEMLQDTLKSAVVSFAALGAGLLFFWQQRNRRTPLRWHALMWLPLLLMAYALGSMAWSHTYLAAVEAIRWFVFSVLLWLGLNCLNRERIGMLAWGVHVGAVVASLWAALQFWTDFGYFPQGPHPASTFVNRNFFAEFAVCTLPFSAMLLARARQSAMAALLAASSALVIVAILMTGTRSALIALWLQVLVVFPVIAWRWRAQLAFGGWNGGVRILVSGVLLGTVLGLGSIATGDSKIAEEGRGVNALQRGFKRTGSISASDPSLGIRMIMWKATARVIQQRPLSGVGAGAWESAIPLYQSEGAQLETDYYVHNEYLQLLAEYGLVGWLFLLALVVYLVSATWRTLRAATPEAEAEGPGRAMYLCGVLALLVVSNVGFPWRMAATGALFAVCLAGLAASDARLGVAAPWAALSLPWRPEYSRALALASVGALVLAAYITQQAAECEEKIVHATKLALTISASGDPNSRRWDATKTELLGLIKEGVAINPHYRKITPMVADELAKWGDWKDATWIWESVLSSRPNVVAIITNVARGYASMGDSGRALQYLEQAKKIQPRAPAVRSLEVILLSRTGKEPQALEKARESIAENVYDFDLVNAAFALGWRGGDYALAARAMELRLADWPETRAAGYLQLGGMYAVSAKDPEKAFAAFTQAMALTPPDQRLSLLSQIPPEYWARLGFPNVVPAPQTSASKG